MPVPVPNGLAYAIDPHVAKHAYIEMIAAACMVGTVLAQDDEFYLTPFDGKIRVNRERMPDDILYLPPGMMPPNIRSIEPDFIAQIGYRNRIETMWAEVRNSFQRTLYFLANLNIKHFSNANLNWRELLEENSFATDLLAQLPAGDGILPRPTETEQLLAVPAIAEDHARRFARPLIGLDALVELFDAPPVPSPELGPPSPDSVLSQPLSQMNIEEEREDFSDLRLPSPLLSLNLSQHLYSPHSPLFLTAPNSPILAPNFAEATVDSVQGSPANSSTAADMAEVELLLNRLEEVLPGVYRDNDEDRDRLLNRFNRVLDAVFIAIAPEAEFARNLYDQMVEEIYSPAVTLEREALGREIGGYHVDEEDDSMSEYSDEEEHSCSVMKTETQLSTLVDDDDEEWGFHLSDIEYDDDAASMQTTWGDSDEDNEDFVIVNTAAQAHTPNFNPLRDHICLDNHHWHIYSSFINDNPQVLDRSPTPFPIPVGRQFQVDKEGETFVRPRFE